MSAVATAETRAGAPDRDRAEAPGPRLFDPPGPTLEDSVVATWDELDATGRARCPVCAGEMSRGGGCERCGSELA
jgi:hypothetical protein